MDIKECYRKMGGNFDDVMQRLGNESFISVEKTPTSASGE